MQTELKSRITFFSDVRCLNKRLRTYNQSPLHRPCHHELSYFPVWVTVFVFFGRYPSVTRKADVCEPWSGGKTDNMSTASDQRRWTGGTNRHIVRGEAKGKFLLTPYNPISPLVLPCDMTYLWDLICIFVGSDVVELFAKGLTKLLCVPSFFVRISPT